MVQPVSATVIPAGSSARAVLPAVPAVASAIAVTCRLLPGECGAATATGTSAARSAPGSGSGTVTGWGVLTPGPSTRTVITPPGGPASASITRISCSGRLTVPANRSVEATWLIRMATSSHGAGQRAAACGGGRRPIAWPGSAVTPCPGAR